MKEKLPTIDRPDDYLDCYGNFRIKDRVCRDHCAVRIRCLIEREQSARVEFYEDLLSAENMSMRMQ